MKQDFCHVSCQLNGYYNLPDNVRQGIELGKVFIAGYEDGSSLLDYQIKPSSNNFVWQEQEKTSKKTIDDITDWYRC